jgi:hypothetical protein
MRSAFMIKLGLSARRGRNLLAEQCGDGRAAVQHLIFRRSGGRIKFGNATKGRELGNSVERSGYTNV